MLTGLSDAFSALQYEVTPCDSLPGLADEMCRGEDTPWRAVIAAGGDGTVQLVANRVPPELPVAVFPLGTENLLAKHFGIRRDIDAACRLVDEGRVLPMDVGQVNGRFFLVMFSCGFDAEVVRRLHSNRQGNIRHWSYAKPIWDAIRNYRYPELHLRIACEQPEGTQVIEISSHWSFVFNLPAYAAGLRIAPDADPTDGCLDVCTFQGGSLSRGLFHLMTVLCGQHGLWSACRRHRATQIRISSDREVPFQIDGDPGGCLPVEIRVLRRRVAILVPPESPAAEP
jgi:YegS/Rv2252/BmrU family lipid kinase